MFLRKYVFETKRTKFIRLCQNIGLGIFVLIIIYVLFSLNYIIKVRSQNKETLTKFFNSSPDLICVYTGDAGRIPLSLKMAQAYRVSNIFISGVYEGATVKGLTLINDPDLKGVDLNQFKIDYMSKNTYENVQNTIQYLRTNKNFNKVLVISSDYHIPRIKYIFEKLIAKEDKFQIYYLGSESNFFNPTNFKRLNKEYYKYLNNMISF